MEIAPIAGVRVMPVTQARPSEPGMTGVLEIELSRTGDDSYSGNNKGTGGQDGQDEDEGELLVDAETEVKAAPAIDQGGINLFA